MVGESINSSRYNAGCNIRNFISFAAVNWFVFFVMMVKSVLTLSLDSTQFKMGYDHQDEDIMVIVPKEFSGTAKVLPDKSEVGHIAYFIKLFLLNKCTETITNDLMQYIITNIAVFAEQVNLTGEVSDAFMNNHPLIPKTKSKDNYVTGRRRSVLLTHPNIIEKYV